MNSVANAKYKELSTNEVGHQYNFQRLVLVTKYRYKMFKNPKTVGIIRDALYDAVERHGMAIKEMSFGDDYAHIHMEISVPNTLSMSQVIQILKSHSASVIFQKIPNFMKLYPRGSFWGGQYSNHSVGPTDESTIKNYIRRQDVSNVDNQRCLFN